MSKQCNSESMQADILRRGFLDSLKMSGIPERLYGGMILAYDYGFEDANILYKHKQRLDSLKDVSDD